MRAHGRVGQTHIKSTTSPRKIFFPKNLWTLNFPNLSITTKKSKKILLFLMRRFAPLDKISHLSKQVLFGCIYITKFETIFKTDNARSARVVIRYFLLRSDRLVIRAAPLFLKCPFHIPFCFARGEYYLNEEKGILRGGAASKIYILRIQSRTTYHLVDFYHLSPFASFP